MPIDATGDDAAREKRANAQSDDSRRRFPVGRCRAMREYGDASVCPLPAIHRQRLDVEDVEYCVRELALIERGAEVIVVDDRTSREIDQ